MKILNSFVRRLAAPLCFAALLIGTNAAWPQIPGSDKSSGGMNTAMIKFFGANTNFISKADLRVLDKNQQETTSMPIGFQMLGNRMRMDVNMSEVKSRDISPEFAATMKSMGMDQMVTIWLPDKKTVISIYPNLKSYAETPMSKDEVDTAAIAYQTEKTRAGRETIDGHACEKNNVTLTDPKGNQQHAVVWNATDLKDFPIQIQMPGDDVTVVLKFKDVKIGKPDASHFDAPEGLKKFDNISALISDATVKRMSANGPK
jgi:hypothetical protein